MNLDEYNMICGYSCNNRLYRL